MSSPLAGSAPPGAALFEVSWEVCNQVGGIYQVLRSKAPEMVERWQDRYFLVGPYLPERAELEYESLVPPGWLGRALAGLAEQGVAAHHGRWLVSGRPHVVLLDLEGARGRLDALRAGLRERHGLETWSRDRLVDEVVVFAEATRAFVELAAEAWQTTGDGGGRRVLVHGHAWLGGLALPQLRDVERPIGTVFTTHATQVGRALASAGEDLYEHLPWIDAAAEAGRHGIRAQHAIERACASSAHVFTTVSPITAEECNSLLGRAPDAITPNGLDVARYDLGADFQTAHGQHKEALHAFSMAQFFPHYAFDLDRTLYFFTSGRFEPRNKGFDLCLETMARLNLELHAAGLDVTVVFFIVTDRPTRSLQPDVLQARGVLEELREVTRRISDQVGDRLFREGAAGGRVRLDDLVDEYWLLRLRATQHALRRGGDAPLVTHVIDHDANDPVLQHMRQLRLRNGPDDRVKVVYHPRFVSPVNPLWGIEYEQFVRGCHLGVFPSRYEPWGYTPLECVAMGVPAITSDLAGFGRHVAESYPDHDDWGVNVLNLRGLGFHDAAAVLTQKLLAFCRLDRRGRIALRNDLQPRVHAFSWSHLVRAYHEAHDKALATAGVAA